MWPPKLLKKKNETSTLKYPKPLKRILKPSGGQRCVQNEIRLFCSYQQ